MSEDNGQGGLTIEHFRINGHSMLTAYLGGAIVGVEKCDLAKSTSRRKFAKSLAEGRPGIRAAEIEEKLLAIAAEQTHVQHQAGDSSEIDVTKVVRPERFITPAVSGLSVPTVTVGLDGRPVGRWVLYLQWADGRRERRALAPMIELPGGDRLWVHPQPSEPGATTPAGWSRESREAWLRGSPAPRPEEVFCRVCEKISEFIDLPTDKAPGITATVALWIMLSYVYPAWPACPYIYVGRPLGSGKSRMFEILSRLVFRPLSSSNLTGAALFRTLHNQGGSLLFDEAERMKNSHDPAVQELLSMLLAGYKRGGRATRLEAVGDTFKTTEFDVYGPKSLACITGLPPALASRCISLMMFRAATNSEKPRRRIDADPGAWQGLRDDLYVLAVEHGPAWLELADRTSVCQGMGGRDFEVWQPILSLATWIEEHGARGLVEIVRQYATETIEDAADDTTPDADVTLLRIFAEMVRDGAPTAKEVLDAVQQEDAATFKHWTPRSVQNRLRLYGVPKSQKVDKRREYRVNTDVLARIQDRHRIDLGVPRDGETGQ